MMMNMNKKSIERRRINLREIVKEEESVERRRINLREIVREDESVEERGEKNDANNALKNENDVSKQQ